MAKSARRLAKDREISRSDLRKIYIKVMNSFIKDGKKSKIESFFFKLRWAIKKDIIFNGNGEQWELYLQNLLEKIDKDFVVPKEYRSLKFLPALVICLLFAKVELRVRRKGARLIKIPYLISESRSVKMGVNWFRHGVLSRDIPKEYGFLSKLLGELRSLLKMESCISLKLRDEYHGIAVNNSRFIYLLKKKKRKKKRRKRV